MGSAGLRLALLLLACLMLVLLQLAALAAPPGHDPAIPALMLPATLATDHQLD